MQESQSEKTITKGYTMARNWLRHAAMSKVIAALSVSVLLVPSEVRAIDCEGVNGEFLLEAVKDTNNAPPNLDKEIYILDMRGGPLPVQGLPLYLVPWMLATSIPGSSFHWEQPTPNSWVLVQHAANALSGEEDVYRFGFQMISDGEGSERPAMFAFSMNGVRHPEQHFNMSNIWAVSAYYIRRCKVQLQTLYIE